MRWLATATTVCLLGSAGCADDPPTAPIPAHALEAISAKATDADLAALAKRVSTTTEIGEWRLDPAADPPAENDRVLHLVVSGTACSGGAGPRGRLRPPVARYLPDRIELVIRLRRVQSFVRVDGKRMRALPTCPGYAPLRRAVVLDEPIEGRRLFDAGVHPPRPVDPSLQTSGWR